MAKKKETTKVEEPVVKNVATTIKPSEPRKPKWEIKDRAL